MKNTNKIPKVGDIIYIESAYYIDSPFRDVTGGKAKIQSVEVKEGGGIWIKLEGFPTTTYGWSGLETLQPYLKEQFGDAWAHRG